MAILIILQRHRITGAFIIADDFPEVRKIVSAGATSKPVKDYELTRYACYLIVQNGDPRKAIIPSYKADVINADNKMIICKCLRQLETVITYKNSCSCFLKKL